MVLAMDRCTDTSGRGWSAFGDVTGSLTLAPSESLFPGARPHSSDVDGLRDRQRRASPS